MDYPVDLTHLARLTGGDKESEKEIFKSFFKESDTHIRAMINARQKGDLPAWRQAVLDLRAASVHVGAMHLIEFLSTIDGGESLSSDIRATQVKIALREIGKLREFSQMRGGG